MQNYRAIIVDETSAGMTAIMVYCNDELIYAHDYFENGATSDYYKEIMTKIAKEDMLSLDTATTWDGCIYEDAEGYPTTEDTGKVFDYLKSDTAFEYIEYTKENGFKLLDEDYRGQSYVLAANLQLIENGGV